MKNQGFCATIRVDDLARPNDVGKGCHLRWKETTRQPDSWEEVNQIQNSAVKEAAKTMQLIMSNPTEREMIRMRQAAQNDWITMKNSERKAGKIETLADLVKDGILTLESAAERAGMSVQAFSKVAGIKTN